MAVPALKTKVPANAADEQQARQAFVGIRNDLERINLGIINPTTGAPTDTPAKGTARFDKATGDLWIYADSGWVSTTLT